MSSLYSIESEEGLAFDNRTSNANFQERLLEAQLQQNTNQSNAIVRLDSLFQSQDPEELKRQLIELESQVKKVEAEVSQMESTLEYRKKKRKQEEGIANMTPEQRALYYKKEQKRLDAKQRKIEEAMALTEIEKPLEEMLESDSDDDVEDELKKTRKKLIANKDVMSSAGSSDSDNEEQGYGDIEEQGVKPDWDIIYEYMLLLSDAFEDPNSLIDSRMLETNMDLKQKAFTHPEVLRQTDYSGIQFTKAKNTLMFDTKDGDIRSCQLAGTCYGQEFSITFDVREPEMVLSNIEFDVEFEMQLDVGSVLQQVKEESNIMGFFRLFVHYTELVHQRQLVFEKLSKQFENSNIKAEILSSSRIQFEGSLECAVMLVFTWKIDAFNNDLDVLDANVENHVEPLLTLEAIAHSEVIEKDKNNVLSKVNESFMFILKELGVCRAVEKVVNGILF
ncbi:hypothetical protein A0J61_03887 [Choanephora cucurbitarum]|uniref:Uncharacterized protein n=1 Tax=Choanephora cucurbitarum TaxID=101091 RepID=A0A1C7NGB8_9FUNG|nr:hypothetical protein A0J61_03887 [Choanephora cucurbitarum]